MYVRAIQDFKGGGYAVKAGQVTELPDRLAQAAIEAGYLEGVEQSDYLERNVATPATTRSRRSKAKEERSDE